MEKSDQYILKIKSLKKGKNNTKMVKFLGKSKKIFH